MPPHASLHEWFRSPEAFCCSYAHNVDDNFGRQQFGGTFLLGFGLVTNLIVSSKKTPLNWAAGPGSDFRAITISLSRLS